jgi:hypothetical protein
MSKRFFKGLFENKKLIGNTILGLAVGSSFTTNILAQEQKQMLKQSTPSDKF